MDYVSFNNDRLGSYMYSKSPNDHIQLIFDARDTAWEATQNGGPSLIRLIEALESDFESKRYYTECDNIKKTFLQYVFKYWKLWLHDGLPLILDETRLEARECLEREETPSFFAPYTKGFHPGITDPTDTPAILAVKEDIRQQRHALRLDRRALAVERDTLQRDRLGLSEKQTRHNQKCQVDRNRILAMREHEAMAITRQWSATTREINETRAERRQLVTEKLAIQEAVSSALKVLAQVERDFKENSSIQNMVTASDIPDDAGALDYNLI